MSRMPRRALIAASLALAACSRAQGQDAAPERPIAIPPLRRALPFPVGVCAMNGEFADPSFTRLLLSDFSQVTAEWEMKMESILREDGGFDFHRADGIADFAARNGLRLHGHTLVWYSQRPAAFARVSGAAFASAYRNYIAAVMGRYRGRVVGWDVVNEPVEPDGSGLRDCLWRANLGDAYIPLAFEHARAADPGAVLILNEYDLETRPAKAATFFRLVESLLKRGAPVGGLGTQLHVSIDIAPGAIARSLAELARFGLPIHISELDVSTRGGRLDLRGPEERARLQARVYGEAAEAFAALPAHQRYAFTVWGLRDRDSWLRHPPNAGDGSDRPTLFDDEGRPKPAAEAVVETGVRVAA